MKNFNLIKLHNEPYNYLVIATNYRSSLSNLNELKNQIDIEFGKVLFDFMLINGNKSNRFIQCDIIKFNCEKKSIKLAESIGDSIRNISSEFFANNKELVEKSALPNALKYLIFTGEIV